MLVAQQEADLVTTHELGHNFGAVHDPDDVPYCAPREDQGGKYVMYPIAVSGDHSNNKVCASVMGCFDSNLSLPQLCVLCFSVVVFKLQ